jgi:hypothetical protein
METLYSEWKSLLIAQLGGGVRAKNDWLCSDCMAVFSADPWGQTRGGALSALKDATGARAIKTPVLEQVRCLVGCQLTAKNGCLSKDTSFLHNVMCLMKLQSSTCHIGMLHCVRG